METAVLPGAEAPSKHGPPLKLILGVIVLASFTVLITWRARLLELTLEWESEQPTLVSKPAPDFSALSLDGRSVSLADFRGQKNVVVAFWASWCGPCRLEMPGLVSFYKRNHTASSDFEILAVSIDEDPKAAAAFAAAQNLNFPVLLDSRHKMADAYQVEGIPTMFIVDKNGKVTYGHLGYDAAMEYHLAGRLGIKPSAAQGGSDGDSSH